MLWTSTYSRLAREHTCSKPAAAAGYKPAPQLGRQIAVCQIRVLMFNTDLLTLQRKMLKLPLKR